MHENNILDLIIISQEHLINNIAVGGHLGSYAQNNASQYQYIDLYKQNQDFDAKF